MKKFKNNKNGFTLVELLAVIVILAIILVIAVPKVMSVIEDSKKATLESTAKMIASAAEKAKVQNTVLGKTDEITCDSVAKINKLDYETCEVVFEDNAAKVSIKGSGKFAGLYVCNGDKTNATATAESCTPVVNATNFTDDDWSTIVAAVKSGNHPYEVGEYKTVDMGSLGTHFLRVANTTKCSELETEPLSKTACGFVLEFADIITTYNMNPAGEYNGTQYDEGSTLGGWPASAMRTYVNETIYNALPEALKEGIINTYVVSSHESNTTAGKIENENAGVLEDGNYWSNDKLYLLSPQEAWGTSFTNEWDSSNGTSRQLDYYEKYKDEGSSVREKFDLETNYSENWWLRSACTDDDVVYYVVNTRGGWNAIGAGDSLGVSPAFRLAQ